MNFTINIIAWGIKTVAWSGHVWFGCLFDEKSEEEEEVEEETVFFVRIV